VIWRALDASASGSTQTLACIIHKSGAPKSFFVRVNNHEMASEFG
jgi:hypothetical protein